MPEQFPTGVDTAGCTLVPLPWPLVPLVAGQLRRLEERGYWQSDEDHERGYNAVAEIYIAMANNCLDDLIESNNRIYRLLDSHLNGTIYTQHESNGELIALPPIGVVPPASSAYLWQRLTQYYELMHNATTGTTYPKSGLNDNVSVRDVLRQLITAIQQTDDLDDDMLARLAEIAVLLA